MNPRPRSSNSVNDLNNVDLERVGQSPAKKSLGLGLVLCESPEVGAGGTTGVASMSQSLPEEPTATKEQEPRAQGSALQRVTTVSFGCKHNRQGYKDLTCTLRIRVKLCFVITYFVIYEKVPNLGYTPLATLLFYNWQLNWICFFKHVATLWISKANISFRISCTILVSLKVGCVFFFYCHAVKLTHNLTAVGLQYQLCSTTMRLLYILLRISSL